nr:Histone-lysine N-methyltransferase EZ1 [Ipomoea batatas]
MSKLEAPPSNPHLDPSSGPPIVVPQEICLTPSEISSIIDSFKDKFVLERHSYIKKKIADNTQELAGVTRDLYKLSIERRNLKILVGDGSSDLPSKRQKGAVDLQNSNGTGSGNNICSSQENGYASSDLRSSIVLKIAVCPIKLPKLEKLPPYTTWVFLHRNQKMTEDQSVIGRRRIYYDKNSGETLICSDSDEEIIEEGEKEFAESEDYILRMTIEKVGLYDTVLDLLANHFSRKPSEVKARYKDLIKEGATSKNVTTNSYLDKDLVAALSSKVGLYDTLLDLLTNHFSRKPSGVKARHKDLIKEGATSKNENTEVTINSYLGKDLDAALSSFNNLFCRRCFVFNCQLHGCSQDLILPKQILVEEELWAHYTPCNCKPYCGKKCPCVVKSIYCEKFCGCPLKCKIRFQGCHCTKNECATDFCPCYASGRECDPDVCCFCWVSCGDGSIGIPPGKVSNHKCQNMKLLLGKRQKVLLGRSDIAGWGVFLKNCVSKNEFIGEYTGELISHFEADKRGKVYDRQNCSFLYNLNDQLVIDAYRMGSKLKFINHSPDPNCCAKIIVVGGEHRLGIFALKDINAGDELLCDYQYDPDTCPAWAKDLQSSSKMDDC